MKVHLLIGENMLEFRVYGYLFIQDYIMSKKEQHWIEIGNF